NTVITSGEFLINNAEDVYVDGSSFTVSVTGTSNDAAQKDNFEALDTSDKGTVTVNDTPNIVYVDVTAPSANLIEGDEVTYTVTLRNQDGLEVKNHGGLNITLSNEVEIYIPENETSGAGKGIATVGSKTIKVDKIVETATADSGKQFEAIKAGKTVTVNTSSSNLKNDIATATENGSENVASEDSLDTINGKNDGQTASGNVLDNDSNVSEVSKITFEGSTKPVSNDGTEIIGKYGTLNISSNGEYTYKVNDDNYYVDKLNVGDKLAEHFTYTTSNGKTAVLTVEVEGRNDAPIISKIETNGVTLTGIYNDYQKDNITKDITAYDLLKEDKGIIFNNENSNLSMNLGNSGTDVSISYLGGNGSYRNILGFYEIDANGNKINLKIMYIDKNSNFENLYSSPKGLTQLTNLKGEIGFFLISDGYSKKDIIKAIDNNWAMTVDKSNNIIFKNGNDTVKADEVFYSNETSNNDGLDHTIALKQNNGLIIGFEDQYGGGDKDYDDFVISVKFTPSESLSNKLFTNIDFSDVDDDSLSEATVTLTNAIDGDKINIAGDLKEGITYTTEYKNGQVIIKFSRKASHEAYKEAIEAIRFSTKNSENERELKFDIEIKDPNGKTDKQSVVIIGKGFDNDAPTIGNESVQTNEDVPYTFSINDFGSYKDIDGDSIDTIKIVTLPDPTIEGTLKYDGVVITAGKEILVKDLGKLVFEPVLNSDKDGSFTFQVSDSRGAYSDIKTMTVGVIAVADAPTVSIDISNKEIVTETVGQVCTTSQELGNIITYLENKSNVSADEIVQLVKDQNNNPKQDQYNLELTSFGKEADLLLYDNVSNQNSTRDINKIELSDTKKLDISSINVITNTVNNTYNMTTNKVIFEGNIIQNGNVNGTSGNDVIIVKGEIQGGSNINAGNGNDLIAILGDIGANQPAIDGGEGIDILYLSKPASSYYFRDIHFHGDLDGHLVDKDTGKTLTFNNIEGIAFGDGTGLNCNVDNISTTTYYKYTIDISATLIDKDSEELSNVTIKNIPVGSELFGADKQENGTYTVKVDETGKAKLTLESQDKLSEDELNSIKASAISRDVSTDGGTEDPSFAISFAGGGDIDLSNLKNIVNLKEINLDNGKENKLSLSLDDVLKLSGNDKQIKITGDEFDSVAFKNTTGENGQAQTWSKTAGEGVDKGFDIYLNSGDPTLQVKVEQQIIISDGVTG
ncbi:VCBS domain-containing protein, partial [Aliarcobacter cryaerophilus]|uniref:VCBS domain-containing protein n=1 Tax=Aliarcobacter cryaerophilus TaxID=28198 RepID=UPI0021B5B35A